MNNRNITRNYSIGLAISVLNLVGTLLLIWLRPISWPEDFEPVFRYVVELCSPVINLIVIAALQIQNKTHRKAYEKAENDEEREKINSSNKLSSYTVIFLSVEFMCLQAYFMLSLYPAVNAPEPGDPLAIESAGMKVLAVMLSVLLIFLGNYTPIARVPGQGFSAGKWTDYNANTKFRSGRYAGKVFVITGAISTVICLFINGNIGVGVVLVAMTVALIISAKKAKQFYYEEIQKEKS